MCVRDTDFDRINSMRPGSSTLGIKPAEANTARNIPKEYRNVAIEACTPRTTATTSAVPRPDWPNRLMVAVAPSTMSMRSRNRKNRIIAVDSAKSPQKILRANASRNVSRINAMVIVRLALTIDGPDKHVFEGAGGWRQRFHLAGR